MSIQPQCMEIDYLYANFVEGSIWRGSSSHCGRVPFLLQASEINQSLGFYQFTARGKDCRLIKSLASSDRNWKTEFISVSGIWAGNPVDVGRDPFAPYSGDVGNLRPEGTSLPFFFFLLFFLYLFIYLFLFVSNPCILLTLQVSNDHP